MKNRFGIVKVAALSVGALAVAGAMAAQPAQAAMRFVSGQAYWTGDPGPVEPGAFYQSGQQQFDPHHYLSWYGEDPQDYKMVVYANHQGAANCVWRARVVNTNWEFRHPYIMVCRK